ncbi:phosphoglycerate mutase-like protein [Xylaria intraflava]|nr:phosphoglycerate mutase-like protein [Xylaria intraflava]
MRLLLIRHGESVDNVAGLYAGSRDSPLTNHGVLQAKRLGVHIADHSAAIGPVGHIFASDLQRAYRTADAVADACKTKVGQSTSSVTLGVIRLKELREKDFGSSEGKKFGIRENSDGSETPESMRLRIDRFLDHHLNPIVDQFMSGNRTAVGSIVIVSHGIILNVLLKALLSRHPPKPTSEKPIVDRSSSEYLASWSNTGVLQARWELSGSSTSTRQHSTRKLHITVEHTNNTDHLHGLKKTRGGIGSAKFDSRQRTMDSFFASASKKRKFDDAEVS